MILFLAILITGASGIIAQVALLRELLITFYGNELSIGIILANWLILEALGSFFLGKRIEKSKNKLEAFAGLILIFSISFPIIIYLVRIWKTIIGVFPGEGLGFLPLVYSSFITLLPVSLTHGALFTFGCKIISISAKGEKQDALSITRVYIFETLGTIFGGIVFAFVLIPYFNSLQIALGVALANIFVCVIILSPHWQNKQILLPALTGQKITSKILRSLSILLFFLCTYLIFGSKGNEIHWLSIKKQWRAQELIHYQNSIYGNVAVTKNGEQYTFFSDGIPIITTPTPDIVWTEEFAHLPILFHSEPEEILIISGGAGGLINEVLKHPVKSLDYVELDPLILKMVKRFATKLTETELSDPRVNIHFTDGRLFVKKTMHRYDVVLVGLSNPQDLQTNRLFTKKFFCLVKNKLKDGGILAIALPGSLTYLSKELKNLNQCILNTLKEVFVSIRTIPGDGTNLYIASKNSDILSVVPAELNQRLLERKIQTGLITETYIEYKLNPRWLNWFLASLNGGTERINQDFKPLGVFYSLSYWNALFSPYMQRVFGYFEKINAKTVFILLGVVVLLFIFLSLRIKKLSKIMIPWAIVSTGFAGMIFDLTLIFSFQALYGFVFFWIIFLTTAFMVGTAIGSLFITSIITRIKNDITYFLRIESFLIVFSGILPLILLNFSPYLERPVIFHFLQILFLVLAILSGILIGAEFPLANKIYLAWFSRDSALEKTNLSKTAGLLYSSDLLGGWLGGIIGGVVLLPILGLLESCLIVAILKISSFIILFGLKNRIAVS